MFWKLVLCRVYSYFKTLCKTSFSRLKIDIEYHFYQVYQKISEQEKLQKPQWRNANVTRTTQKILVHETIHSIGNLTILRNFRNILDHLIMINILLCCICQALERKFSGYVVYSIRNLGKDGLNETIQHILENILTFMLQYNLILCIVYCTNNKIVIIE